MGKFLFGVVGILLIILLAGAIMGQLSREPSFYELEQQRIRLETLQQQAETEAFWAPVRAAALNIFLIVVLFGGACYVAAQGVGHLIFFRHYARPDVRGLLPVLRRDQDAAQRALEDHHAAQIAAAARPMPPAHLVYSPHINYRADGAAGSGLASESAALTLPGLTDVAHMNFIPSVQAILLGPNPREARILALVRQQKGVSEIIQEAWGVKGGAKYSECIVPK